MTITNQEALNERANNLQRRGFNGFKMVLVSLHPDPSDPVEARLDVFFHNTHEIANIRADSRDPKYIFPISGGHRLPAGPGAGQVHVTAISGNPDDTVPVPGDGEGPSRLRSPIPDWWPPHRPPYSIPPA